MNAPTAQDMDSVDRQLRPCQAHFKNTPWRPLWQRDH